MPQLQSGRQVALGEPGLIEAVRQPDETGALNAALIARTSIKEVQDLAEVLPVMYFDETRGTPPDCPTYPSGLLVYEVLEGKSDWSEDEVSDFRAWLDNNEGLQQWLDDYLRRLDDAIRTGPAWQIEELENEGF